MHAEEQLGESEVTTEEREGEDLSAVHKLPVNITLRAFYKGKVLFQSDKKWLHPLFELEAFLLSRSSPGSGIAPEDLLLVDKIIGKAAALLIVRMGIKRVHTVIISTHGEAVLCKYNVAFSYGQRIERVKCLSESFLAEEEDLETAYKWLAERRQQSLQRSTAEAQRS